MTATNAARSSRWVLDRSPSKWDAVVVLAGMVSVSFTEYKVLVRRGRYLVATYHLEPARFQGIVPVLFPCRFLRDAGGVELAGYILNSMYGHCWVH